MKVKAKDMAKGRGLGSQILATCVIVFSLSACNNLDKLLNKVFPPPNLLWADQGYVEFHDDGNITVVMNNLDFHHNILWTPLSYVGVYVFKRGADPLVDCCDDGFKDECSALQENSCMIGMGFSNELGYSGNFYIALHQPQPFDPEAPRLYMPISHRFRGRRS